MDKPLTAAEIELLLIQSEQDTRIMTIEGMSAEIIAISRRARLFIKPLKRMRRKFVRDTLRVRAALDAIAPPTIELE